MGCIPFRNDNNNNIISANNINEDINIENINKNKSKKVEQDLLKPKSTIIKTYFSKTITLKKKEITEDHLLLGHQLDTLSIKREIFLQCKNLPKITNSLNSFIIVYRNKSKS